MKFLKNHKKRQDKWKAGPVDLRWDDVRKVWVAGGSGGGGRGTVWLSTRIDILLAWGAEGSTSTPNAHSSGLSQLIVSTEFKSDEKPWVA